MKTSLVCADASLALKVVLPEADSEVARRLWDEWRGAGTTIIAPTLWGYEVTSVIRNRAHRGRLGPQLEEEALAALHGLPLYVLRPAGLHRRAWELARRFGLATAYDAHYLALAEMVECPFWTADERLFRTVQDELAWVRCLGDRRPTAEN